MKSLAVLLLLLPVAFANLDLSVYPFRATLYEMNGDLYELYWDFSVQDETIEFAVNVSTTGWVGFGLSPNGDMTNSDLVIGWVDNGTAFFHDRFADGRSRPPVDSQQDWILTLGKELNGFTILLFNRKWTTCDPRDRDILAQTTRVVFSWNDADPVNNDPMQVIRHTVRSSASLNLLGGNPQPPAEPADSQDFFIGVENVTIPSQGTTYWCASARLPDAVTQGTHYIYKYSPEIVPENTAFVHHIIIYQCDSLANVTEGASAECTSTATVQPLNECRSGNTMAGWAIGGGDFLFPEGVAQQISGRQSDGQFVVIEMHYDNPDNVQNVVDNSGIRFFYTATTPTNVAGLLTVGASVTQHVIIPPNAPNFTVSAHCSVSCTKQFLPDEGINIFANTFHTHLAGRGLVLERYRYTECSGDPVLEEIEPVEQNMLYDFNYQQANILPNEIQVLPGDTLILNCFYDTTDRNGVTLGGESTQEEMCFAFVLYYPVRDDTLVACGSIPFEQNYTPFIDNYVPENLKEEFRAFRDTINRFDDTTLIFSSAQVTNLFNQLDWTEEQIEAFQNSLVYSENAYVYDSCYTRQNFSFSFDRAIPDARCAYLEDDVCTDFQPPPCCERLGAVGLVMSFMLVLSMLAFAVLLL